MWLLRLVPPGPWGRWLSGSGIFAVTALLLFGLGGATGDADGGRVNVGVALFFCVILGYIVPIHHLIIERFRAAFAQIEGQLDLASGMASSWQRRIEHKPAAWTTTTLTLGVAAGCAHNLMLIGPGDIALALTTLPALLTIIATLLIWIVMTAVIASLLDCALLFRRAALRVRVDPLNTRLLTPFGSVAVSSTLAMIGAQAAFPAMMFESEVTYLTYLPGLIATGLPMLFLFLLPVWPVHRRIARAKREALLAINGHIAHLPRSETAEALHTLSAALVYRREVESAAEWPFDTTVMGRLGLYLVIPPLTWIGAALIEMLLDTML